MAGFLDPDLRLVRRTPSGEQPLIAPDLTAVRGGSQASLALQSCSEPEDQTHQQRRQAGCAERRNRHSSSKTGGSGTERIRSELATVGSTKHYRVFSAWISLSGNEKAVSVEHHTVAITGHDEYIPLGHWYFFKNRVEDDPPESTPPPPLSSSASGIDFPLHIRKRDTNFSAP